MMTISRAFPPGKHFNLISFDSMQSAFLFSFDYSRYCITTAELNDYVGWSVFSIILIMLAFLDCLAISATIVCMWIETLEKKAYKESKDKPIKLRLTQDYLSKLRPPKKHIPEPAPLERIPKPAPPGRFQLFISW